MKQSKTLLFVCTFFLLNGFAFTQSDILIWNGNSDELVDFIKSEDENKISFALQKIIMNPETLKVNYIAINIYKLYRFHKNDKIRQMALVALYKSKHYFLLKNLRDDLYMEKNTQIRKQIYCILDKMPVLSNLN